MQYQVENKDGNKGIRVVSL